MRPVESTLYPAGGRLSRAVDPRGGRGEQARGARLSLRPRSQVAQGGSPLTAVRSRRRTMHKYLHYSQAQFPGAFPALSRRAIFGRVGKLKRAGPILDGGIAMRGDELRRGQGRGGGVSLSRRSGPGNSSRKGLGTSSTSVSRRGGPGN